MSDMLFEASANAISGSLSFVGGMCGGIVFGKIPSVRSGFLDYVKYQSGIAYFGVYPTKFLVSKIKNSLQEVY